LNNIVQLLINVELISKNILEPTNCCRMSYSVYCHKKQVGIQNHLPEDNSCI